MIATIAALRPVTNHALFPTLFVVSASARCLAMLDSVSFS